MQYHVNTNMIVYFAASIFEISKAISIANTTYNGSEGSRERKLEEQRHRDLSEKFLIETKKRDIVLR